MHASNAPLVKTWVNPPTRIAASGAILLRRAIARMTQRRRALPARPQLIASERRGWPIVRAT